MTQENGQTGNRLDRIEALLMQTAELTMRNVQQLADLQVARAEQEQRIDARFEQIAEQEQRFDARFGQMHVQHSLEMAQIREMLSRNAEQHTLEIARIQETMNRSAEESNIRIARIQETMNRSAEESNIRIAQIQAILDQVAGQQAANMQQIAANAEGITELRSLMRDFFSRGTL